MGRCSQRKIAPAGRTSVGRSAVVVAAGLALSLVVPLTAAPRALAKAAPPAPPSAVSTAAAATAPGGSGIDGLWARAVSLAAAGRHLLPGSMVTRFEVRGGDDDDPQVSEEQVRLRLGAGGRVETEVVRAVEKGKDVTEERRREVDRRRTEEEKQRARAARDGRETKEEKNEDGRSVSLSGAEINPFLPSAQEVVAFSRTAETREIDGRTCVGYDYRLPSERGGGVIVGRAWLDAADGTPRETLYTVDPLPSRVKRMETTVRYTLRDSALVAVEMTIDGEGGWLFIRKQVHGVIRMSDHWEAPDSLVAR